VIVADRHINDKVVISIKTKVHRFHISLLAACGRCHRHLVVDTHRVACVAGQLRQDINEMIVASGGSRVLFASKHVIALQIKSKVLARAHRLSHSIRMKHQDRSAHGSTEEAHPQVQTETSDGSLNSLRHVSHTKKRAPVKVPNLGAAEYTGGALGRQCLSAESIHGRSCPAHFLEVLGSAADSEISSTLRSVRARHD